MSIGAVDDHTLKQMAGVLIAHREAIVREWLRIVASDARAAAVEPTDLRDGIDDYVEQLARAIALDGEIDHRGTAAWVDIAKKHALTRVRIGFDIEQLVHEFIVLRRVIFATVRQQAGLDPRQMELLAELIEGAIASAVKSYVEARDFEQRKQEAEHVAFITHELRNPLDVTMLAASKLRRDLGAVKELELILSGGRRLKELIDKVLAAERLEIGELEVHAVDVDMREIVDHAVSAAMLAAADKGIDVDVSVTPGVVVHADPELLTSAIQNLVDNAVKFTDHGQVRVTSEVREDVVTVHVHDSCDGLSPEELRTIFQPFKRGHSKKPGTGLGLAIARRAIEEQGGVLDAESAPGHGCHFWLSLPRRSAH